MSKIELLRVFLNQRLIAAAEEIFGVVEETIAGYQEEASRTKKENGRLRSMLDVCTKPEMLLTIRTRDHEQLTVVQSDEEDPSMQPEASCNLVPDLEPTHIKEEQEEPRTSNQNDYHINEFINSYGCVTSAYYQDPTESLHRAMHSVPSTSTTQLKTELYLENNTVSQPANEPKSSAANRNGSTAQIHNRVHTVWTESGEPLSGVKALKTKTTKGPNSLVNMKDRKSCHLKSHSTPCVSWDATPSCKVCGQQLDSMASLLDHVPTHTQDKERMCGVCGKLFQSTETMLDHIQTHNGAKCCHVCGKYFAWDAFLKRHLRSHTGEKPFRCHYCGKGFTQCGHLNLHMRSHTGEKPHQCQDCGKCFSQNTSLIVHMRTHTGEKPYMCPMCRKCFSTSSMLKRHQTAAHKQIGAMSAANGALLDSVHGEARPDGFPEQEPVIMPFAGDENQAAD